MASEWAEKCGSDHGQPEALDRPYEYIGGCSDGLGFSGSLFGVVLEYLSICVNKTSHFSQKLFSRSIKSEDL